MFRSAALWFLAKQGRAACGTPPVPLGWVGSRPAGGVVCGVPLLGGASAGDVCKLKRDSTAFTCTLVITVAESSEVITMEMGPWSQKAKNTIGPDLRSFLGMRLSTLNSNIDHQFPGHFWIITQNNLK